MVDAPNNSTLMEVKERFEVFKAGHMVALHDGADLADAILQSLGCDADHRRRVRNAFMGRPRKRIKFSEARQMLGVKDARSWWTLCRRDERYKAIEVMQDTATTAYVWEDEVCALLAEQQQGREKINGQKRITIRCDG